MADENASSDEHEDKDTPAERVGGTQELRVVGIGASAGGIQALKSFFSEISAGCGIVFVVVMHLSPDRKSKIAELLDAATTLHVSQVEGRTAMQPDHVYLIPPGKNIEITDGHLTLSELDEPRWKRTPIDHFFRTLAYAHPDGTGILFSGGGTDGTIGMKAIKEQGGLLMAQDPEEAEHDAMPRHAIATGEVDFVLKTKELARKVVELNENADLYQLAVQADALPETAESVLAQILTYLNSRVGHDFSGYKRSTVLRRLQRRMRVAQVENLSEYLEYLQGNEDEPDELFDDLLISVTRFFRDPESWDKLEQEVIPKLFEGKTGDDELRAWVPGCATGEEAYSLVMLLLEHAENITDPPSIKVFGCDLSKAAVTAASKGVYPESIAADVPKERLRRFFIKRDYHYQVKNRVRDLVLFAPHDILKDPPFSRQDLIVCRNLMIYFHANLQEKVLKVFHYALNSGGYLFLGNSESTQRSAELFRAVNKKHRFYVRRRPSNDKQPLPELPLTVFRPSGVDIAAPPQREFPEVKQTSNLELHQQSLEAHAPPSILIDENEDILHISESANRYLNYPAGSPTYDILRAIRKELRLELRTMLIDAFNENRSSTSQPIQMQIDGSERHVHLMVRPAGEEDHNQLALILFVEADTVPDSEEWSDIGSEDNSRMHRLAKELDKTKARLQTTIEEYETSETELKAANEELQSINEEYKSTLEELETSQEELESVNEELQTVNAELNNKVEELTDANNDLKNLMSSTDVATVFLNRQLQIERFTSQVSDLFNIMERDRGRPLDHVTHKFVNYGTMVSDAEEVLESLDPFEREVQDENDRWYLLRMLPYRTVEDSIEGVVVTFVDITRLKQAQDELRDLASQLVISEQHERHRIAQILHDDLQQQLYSVQMRIAMLKQGKSKDWEELSKQLDETDQHLEDAIERTRNLTMDLSPPVLKGEGLVETLQFLTIQMDELHNLEVDVEGEDGLYPATEEMRMLLFQVVRELLFNVVKHAGTDSASVRLQRKDDHLRMQVSDDGRGCDPEKVFNSKDGAGFGLPHLRERIQLFGGEIGIDSAPGKGMTVKVTMPVKWADSEPVE